MKHANHRAQVNRLKRVHGQVAGIIRLVEDERYCIDILTQLRAARSALRKVEEQVLREHAAHCVAGAMRGGDPAERERKLDELMAVLGRFSE